MDTYFNLSMLVGVVAAPTNLLVIVLVGALVATRFQRFRTLGSRLALIAAAVLAALAAFPFGDAMLVVLERQFSPLENCAGADRVAPTGVIVLGGAVGSIRRGDRFEATLGEAAERVTYAAVIGPHEVVRVQC